MSRRVGAAAASAACAALLGALPAGALAQEDGRPIEAPTADQYVEGFPGVGGPKSPRIDRGKGRARPLAPAARTAVRRLGDSSAPLLERVATAPELGAPPPANKRQRAAVRAEDEESPPAALAAAVETAGTDANLLLLVVALALMTAYALGLVAYRRSDRHAG